MVRIAIIGTLALAACGGVRGSDIACELDGHCPEAMHCAPERRCATGARSPFAVCTPRAGQGPQCACAAGYEGDGLVCTRADPCTLAACAPDADCVEEGGEATCRCRPLFEGDGRTCRPLDREETRWALPDARAEAEFEVDGEVVHDKLTGLVWQRGFSMRQVDRDEAVALCAALNVAGHTDWLLPTRAELSTLADRSRQAPAIPSQAFPDTPSESFWTATLHHTEAAKGWTVQFWQGKVSTEAATNPGRARCVRPPSSAAAPPPARYTATADTVSDHRTGRTWARQVEDDKHPQTSGAAVCAARTAGGGVWRLPTIRELESLVNPRTTPALDGQFHPPADYPASQYGQFWSSTLSGTASAWILDFGAGVSTPGSKAYTYNVRCVR